jgi:hypothetical protein
MMAITLLGQILNVYTFIGIGAFFAYLLIGYLYLKRIEKQEGHRYNVEDRKTDWKRLMRARISGDKVSGGVPRLMLGLVYVPFQACELYVPSILRKE